MLPPPLIIQYGLVSETRTFTGDRVYHNNRFYEMQAWVQALGSVKRLETIVLLWRYINKIELNWIKNEPLRAATSPINNHPTCLTKAKIPQPTAKQGKWIKAQHRHQFSNQHCTLGYLIHTHPRTDSHTHSVKLCDRKGGEQLANQAGCYHWS